MKNTKIMKSINSIAGRAGLKLKAHSPEILIVTGVVGAVASAVMACRATTKLSGILEKSKENVDEIHGYMERPDKDKGYTEKDYKKDLLIVYKDTAVDLVKLYGPSVTLGALSITSILASHNIIRKRNAAVSAALAGLDRSFKEYRGRVAERFGADVERELRHNIKSKEIEETVVDGNGKEKTVKKTVGVSGLDQYSDYACFFDAASKAWEKDPEYNLMFLKSQQQYANDLLRARGHLFLNEVYDMIGVPPKKAGQIVGWVYDEKNPVGDNYVDFGIYDVYKENSRDFVNGYEPVIILDFNVDGNILDMI